MKLKRVKPGKYITVDGTVLVEKFDGFWYATNITTGQSVVDSESKFYIIHAALESYLKRR